MMANMIFIMVMCWGIVAPPPVVPIIALCILPSVPGPSMLMPLWSTPGRAEVTG
jgi:hypothetical protein